MRLIEIENWALNIIQQVETRQPNEDARVELKTSWIDPYKAARQLAGHANAARGDPVLWLIGLNQKTGVVGVAHKELSSWLPQVSSYFDGLAPDFVDLNIPYKNSVVVALFINTERAPFIVKNPEYGSKSGVCIAHEVPWREGTTTRTARRSDLIQLLVPKLALPEVELLEVDLSIREHRDRQHRSKWNLEMDFYMIPNIGVPVFIPFHRCDVQLVFTSPDVTVDLSNIHLKPPYKFAFGSGSSSTPDSVTATHTSNELVLEGPARVNLVAEALSNELPTSFEQSSPTILARLGPVHTNQRLILSSTLRRVKVFEDNVIAKWGL